MAYVEGTPMLGMFCMQWAEVEEEGRNQAFIFVCIRGIAYASPVSVVAYVEGTP